MLYDDFDRMICRYEIEVLLVNKTPLSVGSGSAFGSVDNPVIRLSGRPYIPGSTLKGVLRSSAERYANSVFPGEQVCNILRPKDELDRKDLEKERYVPCLVCSVFGGPTIASHVYFSNALPDKDIPTTTLRHVAIDRVTGAARSRALYDVEQVDPETEFKCRITVENIDLAERDNKRSKLVIYTIKRLVNGVFVGGKKSIGNGLVMGKVIGAKRIFMENNQIVVQDFTQQIKELVETKDESMDFL